MLIAIDVGNTTCSIAGFVGDDLVARRTLSTAALTPSDITAALAAVCVTPSPPHLGVASVVPDTTGVLNQAIQSLAPPPASVHLIASGSCDIIDHTLSSIQTTGVDRLLAARGVLATRSDTTENGLDAAGTIVIQVGSAITLDAIDADETFRGGMILPGAQMWLDALATAARLPSLDVADADWTTPRLGTNTPAAILGGLTAGIPGAVTAGIHHLRASNIADTWNTSLITGGGAAALAPHLSETVQHTPDLVLVGIRSYVSGIIQEKGYLI